MNKLNTFPGYCEWTESSMAKYLIEYWDRHDVNIVPEIHYNNYGTRGVVDLFNETGGLAYELKSESAVNGVSGANAIIRQYNKMRDNFNIGSDYNAKFYDLLFSPSKSNLYHLIENASIYNSLNGAGVRIGVLMAQENGIARWHVLSSGDKGGVSLPQSFNRLEKVVTASIGESYEIKNYENLVKILRKEF